MSVLVKKSLVIEAGMFDETLLSAEDEDLWIRIVKDNGIKFIDEPLIKYRVHSHNKSHNAEKMHFDSIQILNKVLKDRRMCVPRSLINARLARAYYLLAKDQYSNGKYSDALSSLISALKTDVFLAKNFFYKEDRLRLKIKKIFNPFGALVVYSFKALFDTRSTIS